jgi:hypothetical protein
MHHTAPWTECTKKQYTVGDALGARELNHAVQAFYGGQVKMRDAEHKRWKEVVN